MTRGEQDQPTDVGETLPSPLGLIAGEGNFPFMVADEARRRGLRLVALAIEGEADSDLEDALPDGCQWIGVAEISRCVRLFREAGVSKAIMAGRVHHVNAFQILRPDWLMLKVLARLPSRNTQALLETLADVLAEEGVELLDSTLLMHQHMASEGAMTRRNASKAELESLLFGLDHARGLAALDIGQTVVVKEKAVVSAEAMEGTDRAIRRAKDVVSGPFCVVKVARPSQDMRFDVPVVGPTTIESMVEAGATALGLETGRVLMLERERLIRAADEKGIAICGVTHA